MFSDLSPNPASFKRLPKIPLDGEFCVVANCEAGTLVNGLWYVNVS